jgi:hypothetical protein
LTSFSSSTSTTVVKCFSKVNTYSIGILKTKKNVLRMLYLHNAVCTYVRSSYIEPNKTDLKNDLYICGIYLHKIPSQKGVWQQDLEPDPILEKHPGARLLESRHNVPVVAVGVQSRRVGAGLRRVGRFRRFQGALGFK